MQEKIYTYSKDFFMTAFFTLRACGISITVLVAGGGVTLACNNSNILQFNKEATLYLENSTTCAFRLHTTRRPHGTKGRVSVNSTDVLGELFLLAFPSVSLSARGLSLSVVSSLG
jgi:hypothetical protein